MRSFLLLCERVSWYFFVYWILSWYFEDRIVTFRPQILYSTCTQCWITETLFFPELWNKISNLIAAQILTMFLAVRMSTKRSFNVFKTIILYFFTTIGVGKLVNFWCSGVHHPNKKPNKFIKLFQWLLSNSRALVV